MAILQCPLVPMPDLLCLSYVPVCDDRSIRVVQDALLGGREREWNLREESVCQRRPGSRGELQGNGSSVCGS
eukprot:2773738-Rhodomonas_salina.1